MKAAMKQIFCPKRCINLYKVILSHREIHINSYVNGQNIELQYFRLEQS